MWALHMVEKVRLRRAAIRFYWYLKETSCCWIQLYGLRSFLLITCEI